MPPSPRKPRSKQSEQPPAGVTPVYDSALMHERRQRILEETRRVIEEQGIENLSMRELCKRADVAQRTLYNAFGNKDRIVGLAIRDIYLEQFERMRFESPADTIEGVIDRLTRICTHFGRQKNYIKAVLDIYFSPDPHKEVTDMMRELSSGNVMPWLSRLQRLGQINPDLSLDEVAGDMTDLIFSIMRQWSIGEMGVTRMTDQAVRGFLVVAIGATTGKAQTHAMQVLAQRKLHPARSRAKVV
jgi:AcrR family transcriptional regulator